MTFLSLQAMRNSTSNMTRRVTTMTARRQGTLLLLLHRRRRQASCPAIRGLRARSCPLLLATDVPMCCQAVAATMNKRRRGGSTRLAHLAAPDRVESRIAPPHRRCLRPQPMQPVSVHAPPHAALLACGQAPHRSTRHRRLRASHRRSTAEHVASTLAIRRFKFTF
jgi:hypothetical protein